MRHIQISLILFCLALLTGPATAQIDFDNIQLKARVGYNIGATAPLGIPASIRGIESFKLIPDFRVGFDAMYPLSEKFGIAAGLFFETKGMDGEVTTKGYHMKVKMDDAEMEGLYTGHVRQKVQQRMLTIPLQLSYRISEKVELTGGPYLSLLLAKEFSGYAFDGYLRKDDPTGAKVVMGNQEGEWATYDFSDEMRTCQLGATVGVNWDLFRRLGLSADLSWGLTGIHRSDFKTVEQTLYPIYGTIGIFYRIK
ncbi:MAG: PorT family protein [Bacteroidaceae bacterium]|nr:PorT family protein [Bacteroidaceae bacterium]